MAGGKYTIPQAVEGELLGLMREGRKIEAIKVLRAASGLGLADAKAAVERFSMDQGMSRHGGKAAITVIDASNDPTIRHIEMPPALHDEVLRLIGQNQKIAAIKLVREKTNLGLKEAKEAVDSVELGQTPTLAVRDFGEGPTPDLGEVREKVRQLALSGKVIEAIKVWREATGLGLREAKEEVEKIMQEGSRPATSPTQLPRPSIPTAPSLASPPPQGAGDASRDYAPDRGDERHDQIELEEQVLFLLRAGRTKDAVKMYAQATGETPGDAKKAVKKIAMTANLKTGPCFVATACYGSFEAPEVVALRAFRDRRLMTWRGGVELVKIYYRVSPSLARAIAGRPLLGRVVRAVVIGPIVALISKGGR